MNSSSTTAQTTQRTSTTSTVLPITSSPTQTTTYSPIVTTPEQPITALPVGFIECTFYTSSIGLYTCKIQHVLINNENMKIHIGRLHSGRLNDTHVKSVEFSSSSLSHIPVELFKTFKNLQHLYVFNSKMKTVNKLSNCANLEYYHAYNNEIKEGKRGSLTACKKLKQIYLYNNPIDRLEDGFFYKNATRLDLRLDNCEIDKIQPSFFNSVQDLYYLNLLNNKCINRPFNNVNPSRVIGIKPYFFQCFENFKNSVTTKAPILEF
jgi:Leucine-rich repeat (LRR) protein